MNDGLDNDLKSVKLKSLPRNFKRLHSISGQVPFFIYRLGKEVDWEDEQECLDGILREIALL